MKTRSPQAEDTGAVRSRDSNEVEPMRTTTGRTEYSPRRNGKTAVIAVTRRGADLGAIVCRLLEKSDLFLPARLASQVEVEHVAYEPPLRHLLKQVFTGYENLVMILALGAAFRLISPLVGDKSRDPGVVVIDEKGMNVISLISGHLGRANHMARLLGAYLGAHAVITTATDLNGLPALDMILEGRGWVCEDRGRLPRLISAVLEGEEVTVVQDGGEDLARELETRGLKVGKAKPEEMSSVGRQGWLMIISDRDHPPPAGFPSDRVVRIRPRRLVLGLGCRKNVRTEEIESAVREVLAQKGLSPTGIRAAATTVHKEGEKGLVDFTSRWGIPLIFLSREELEGVEGPTPPSPWVMATLGLAGVCEKAALAASGGGRLLVPKTRCGRVTVAVAEMLTEKREGGKGHLKIVGIGPGDPGLVSPRAWRALLSADLVLGYSTYIQRLKGLIEPGKTLVFGMGEEMERVKVALQEVRKGKNVCLVSGGDPGIYGMAGALGDLLLTGFRLPDGLDVEIIPGIPALCAAAALLGAPLAGDFAVISLSDYLTDWEEIERKLRSAAEADLVLVIYNPSSSRRKEGVRRAVSILKEYRSERTPVGMVKNAFRPGQQVFLGDLSDLSRVEIGMDCLLIVGNSDTRVMDGVMITPRGYGKRCAENE